MGSLNSSEKLDNSAFLSGLDFSKEPHRRVVFDIDDTLCLLSVSDVEVPQMDILKYEPDWFYYFYPNIEKLFLIILHWGWSVDFFSAGGDLRNKILMSTYLKKMFVKYSDNIDLDLDRLSCSHRLLIFSSHHCEVTSPSSIFEFQQRMAKSAGSATTESYEIIGPRKKNLRSVVSYCESLAAEDRPVAADLIDNIILVEDERKNIVGSQYPYIHHAFEYVASLRYDLGLPRFKFGENILPCGVEYVDLNTKSWNQPNDSTAENTHEAAEQATEGNDDDQDRVDEGTDQHLEKLTPLEIVVEEPCGKGGEEGGAAASGASSGIDDADVDADPATCKKLKQSLSSPRSRSTNKHVHPYEFAAFVMGMLCECKDKMDEVPELSLRSALDATLSHGGQSKIDVTDPYYTPWYINPYVELKLQNNDLEHKVERWISRGNRIFSDVLGGGCDEVVSNAASTD